MPNLEPGQTFGRFSVINLVRQDELGTTYRAYDSNGARDVNLTLIAPAYAAQAGFADRFRALTGQLLKLSHPNILATLDAGVIDSIPYIATAAMDATTLAERLSIGGLSPSDMQKLFGQMAAALSYAHSQGLVDGALAPERILVDSGGNALLSGLGLWRLRQAAPTAAPPDQRGDVYALGALLLALLTGKTLLSNDASLSDALHHLTELLPSERATAVAAAYERVIRQALSPNPAARFSTVSDLVTAWQQAGQTAGETATPGTPSAGPAPKLARPASVPAFTPPKPPPAPKITPPITMPPVTPPAGPSPTTYVPPAQTAAPAPGAVVPPATPPTNVPPAANLVGPPATSTPADSSHHALLDDSARLLQELAEQRAGGKMTPEQHAELARLVQAIRDISDQRARGELTVQQQRDALRSLARQLRTIRTQDAGTHAPVHALEEAAFAATKDAAAAAAATAAAQARPVARTATRWALGGFIGFILVVICLLACVAAVVFSPDSSPTPQSVPESTAVQIVVPTLAAPIVQPSPSATFRPTLASRRPTAPPQVTTVVFTDTFASGACLLPEGDNFQGTLACDSNQYVMTKKANPPRWVYYNTVYQDLVLEADLQFVSGPATTEYGLIWRVAPDGKSFYGFTLTPGGRASIFSYHDSGFDYFTQGFPVSQTRPGATSTNHLQIAMQGTQISFAINDQPLVLTLNDSRLQSGSVGLIIAGPAPNGQAAFSNLAVSQFGPSALQPGATPGLPATPRP